MRAIYHFDVSQEIKVIIFLSYFYHISFTFFVIHFAHLLLNSEMIKIITLIFHCIRNTILVDQ